MGKYKIQLLDYKDGKEAGNYIRRWPYNASPGSGEEYIYLRFRITPLSAAKHEKVYVSNLINMSSGLFDRTGTKEIRQGLLGICPEEKSLPGVAVTGGSLTCYYAVIIPSGNTPVTYRLETGYDSKKHESKYTWFTTKR